MWCKMAIVGPFWACKVSMDASHRRSDNEVVLCDGGGVLHCLVGGEDYRWHRGRRQFGV